jgi:hypothetical protein
MTGICGILEKVKTIATNWIPKEYILLGDNTSLIMGKIHDSSYINT